MLLQEYHGYTIRRIEHELTWEQVFLLVETITARYVRHRQLLETALDDRRSAMGGGRRREADFDIEDVAEGRALGCWFPVTLVQKEEI